MNEKMYKYFCDNNLLTHGIGEISEKETYYKFESIIRYGGLVSKKRLKEMGVNVSGKVNGYRNTPDSQISLFDPTLPPIKKRLLSENYQCFLPFDPNVVFFVIDRNGIDLHQNPSIPFELNEDSGFVSIENFKGIIAPNGCAEYLDKIQKKYGFNLPIYDFDFNITNNLELDTNKTFK